MWRHLCVCLVAACGADTISLDDLRDEYVVARCHYIVNCEFSPDLESCESSTSIGIGWQWPRTNFDTILAAIHDGSIVYDDRAAAVCVASMRNSRCSFVGYHVANPCEDVFTGTVPTGGACVSDIQCANDGTCVQDDSTCDNDLMCCPGTCMGGLTESPIGGPCRYPLVCPTNSYCGVPAGSVMGTCHPIIATEGAACEYANACANPMYCNLVVGDRTCKKAAASGADCKWLDDIPCADIREHCDYNTQTCVKNVGVGEKCGEPYGPCVGYAICAGTPATCRLKVGAGEACRPGDCAVLLQCVNGICQPTPPPACDP